MTSGMNSSAPEAVENQIDDRGAFCVVLGFQCGENNGHRGADVDTADDECRKIKRHKPLHSEGLQDTDGSGGTLDDCAENNTDDKSENRILGVQNKVLEHDRILERSH